MPVLWSGVFWGERKRKRDDGDIKKIERKEARKAVGGLLVKGLACPHQSLRPIPAFLLLLSRGTPEPLAWSTHSSSKGSCGLGSNILKEFLG